MNRRELIVASAAAMALMAQLRGRASAQEPDSGANSEVVRTEVARYAPPVQAFLDKAESLKPRLIGTWSETPAWFRTKLFVASDASIALSFSDVSDAHQFFTSPLRSSNNLDYRANPPHGRNTDIGCR